MRESLQRQCGPWLLDDLSSESSTRSKRSAPPKAGRFRQAVQGNGLAPLMTTLALLWPATAWAQQSPWERAAQNLEQAFTGPLARSLALVAIVIGGLLFMFGESGAKRQISGIVFGGGLALFAAQFLAWLF